MSGIHRILKGAANTQLKKEVNSTCHYFVYQPKLPVGTKDKFKK